MLEVPDVAGSSPVSPTEFTWQGGVGELLGSLRTPDMGD